MREIKFRAWDGSYMVSVNHMTWGYGDVVGISEINEEMPKWFTLMQYTGLKDKNGVGIYEGDLIKDRHRSNPLIVEYENEGYLPFAYSGGGETDWFDCEVIGNIYENKELIP